MAQDGEVDSRPHTATVAELGSQPMGSQLQATSPSRTLKNATWYEAK